jgi:hypothetical protein
MSSTVTQQAAVRPETGASLQGPVDAAAGRTEDAAVTAAVPSSPASLWTSVSKVQYSITHSDNCASNAWIDCACVIHPE